MRLDETRRDYAFARGIIHLHSPYSHDACDGNPMPGGEPNLSCMADLRAGLCTTGMDFAFLTDHPAHAADQDFDNLSWIEAGDEPILAPSGRTTANVMACPDGHTTLVMPGIEDELMPVGLSNHAADDPAGRNILYNESTPDTVRAFTEQDAVVLVAHTEKRRVEDLAILSEAGLAGIEMFNLHAMVDPIKRERDLGLDPTAWLTDAAPFTNPDGIADPDLMFLAFYQEQTPSIATWDTLSATRTTVGVAGTDAHQNVMPLVMRDGERLDSYRRMMRWFSNWLLVDGTQPEDHRDALRNARVYTVFETLGTPTGFDVYVETNTATHEVGATVSGGTLQVTCPTLAPTSPTNMASPDITARILRDGAPWATGCGSHVLADAGIYRVVFDITPTHLEDFLGEDPAPFLHTYPWIYANPIRVVAQ